MAKSEIDYLLSEYQRLRKLAQNNNVVQPPEPEPPKVAPPPPIEENKPPAEARPNEGAIAGAMAANITPPQAVLPTVSMPAADLANVPSWKRGLTARRIAASTGQDWRQLLADYYAATGDVSKYEYTMKNIARSGGNPGQQQGRR